MTPIEWIPLEERGRAKVRRGAHQWHKPKRLPWPWCIHCGLLALKNDVTKRAIKAECISLEDA